MKKYIVSFKPSQPYFFGSEKSFSRPGRVNNGFGDLYYICSEDTPSQTTIFGALRYVLLPHTQFKGLSEDQKKENKIAVGENSYSFNTSDDTSYGLIKSISPVFLLSDKEHGRRVYVRTPLDHRVRKLDPETNESVKNVEYTPFSEYSIMYTSYPGCCKLYAEDYIVKDGLASSWMDVRTGEILDDEDVIKTQLRVGINRNKQKDGFFKRDYKVLSDDLSFAIVAEFSDEFNGKLQRTVALLGQGHTPFSIELIKISSGNKNDADLEQICDPFEAIAGFLSQKHQSIVIRQQNGSKSGGVDSLPSEADNIPEQKTTKYKLVYCCGDALMPAKDNPYYNSLFAITTYREYRGYTTNIDGKYELSQKLKRLVKAGSVFITDEECINNNSGYNNEEYNKAYRIAGFNKFCITEINNEKENKYD